MHLNIKKKLSIESQCVKRVPSCYYCLSLRIIKMFQRVVLDLLLLLTSIVSCYFVFQLFFSENVPADFRITWENKSMALFVFIGWLFCTFILRFLVICTYDTVKNNQREREIDLRKQLLMLGRLNNDQQFGITAPEPFMQSTQEFIINERDELRTKSTNIIHPHDSHMQKFSSPKPTRKAPPPPYKDVTMQSNINDQYEHNDGDPKVHTGGYINQSMNTSSQF